MVKDLRAVTDEETATCATSEDWARLFIARNPTVHALSIVNAYQRSGVAERFGNLETRDVQRLQAQLGAAGMSDAKLAELDARAASLRAQAEVERAEWIAYSAKELAELSNRKLIEALIHRISSPAHRHQDVETIRYFLLAQTLNGEVNNGGFDQYFRNASGKDVDAAANAFVAIGATTQAKIVRRAYDLFRRKYLNVTMPAERDPEFDPLDREYYASSRDLRGVLAQYARDHMDDFCGPPESGASPRT